MSIGRRTRLIMGPGATADCRDGSLARYLDCAFRRLIENT
jgi:hypothetical protein